MTNIDTPQPKSCYGAAATQGLQACSANKCSFKMPILEPKKEGPFKICFKIPSASSILSKSKSKKDKMLLCISKNTQQALKNKDY